MSAPDHSNRADTKIAKTADLFYKGAHLLHEMRRQPDALVAVRFHDWADSLRTRLRLEGESTASDCLIWLWEALRSAPDLSDIFGDLPSAKVPWSSADQRFEVFAAGASFVIGMNRGEVARLLWPTAKSPVQERVSVVTEERLVMRPGKGDRLECCDCRAKVTVRVDEVYPVEREADIMRIEPERITISDQAITVTVDSLNQAYTVSSRRLEPDRRSHGGRTYDHVVYAGTSQRMRLEDIRQLVESGTWPSPIETGDRIESVFQEPDQWGLRGDPYLWRELRERFAAEGLPETLLEFSSCLEAKFKELVGVPIANCREAVFVDRYSHGGMSSGRVDPEWWRQTGLPLLHRRFSQP